MNRKYVYFIFGLTLLGLFLIAGFFIQNKSELEATQDVQTENPPFLTYVSGSGIVEPASGNIIISSALNRVVEKINVSVNEQVKKGDILLQLYNQDLKAALKIKQLKFEESLSNLHRLMSLPRCEDVTIAQENVNKAQAALSAALAEYCIAKRHGKCSGEKCIRYYKYQQAESDLLVAQTQLEKVNAGAWPPEIRIAQDEVEIAKAAVEAMETEVDRTYVRAPIDGTILQIKIREGEILDQNLFQNAKPAIILGNTNQLNLRVSIDQFNESRFHPKCPAVAFKQGNTETEFQLKFLHIEPFMVPKKYLTNELHEKVDTQTFEIVYRIEKNDAHLFVGEQMDVYIYMDKENKCEGAPAQEPGKA